MIATPPDFRALVSELTNASWALAALGVLLESELGPQLVAPRTLDELTAACPQLPRRRIAGILAVACARGAVVADGDRFQLATGVVPVVQSPMRAAIAADIRCQLLQPMAMLDGAPTGWHHTAPAVGGPTMPW